MDFTTADLWDDHANNLSCLSPLFQHYGKKNCFAGKITTLKLHEDNSLVREILEEDGTGKVLVIDGLRFSPCLIAKCLCPKTQFINSSCLRVNKN